MKACSARCDSTIVSTAPPSPAWSSTSDSPAFNEEKFQNVKVYSLPIRRASGIHHSAPIEMRSVGSGPTLSNRSGGWGSSQPMSARSCGSGRPPSVPKLRLDGLKPKDVDPALSKDYTCDSPTSSSSSMLSQSVMKASGASFPGAPHVCVRSPEQNVPFNEGSLETAIDMMLDHRDSRCSRMSPRTCWSNSWMSRLHRSLSCETCSKEVITEIPA